MDLSSGDDRIQVATVTTESEFAALKDAWNELARQSVAPSVFLSHEWFEAAWAWRRLASTLELKLVRKAHRLVGILPLIRTQTGTKGLRYLELLTVPDTQLSDLIALPDVAIQASKALATVLATRADWDILRLGYLSPTGAVARMLAPALTSRGLHLRTEDAGANSFVPLTGTWEDYYSARSRRLKKANNLANNRLQKSGTVRIDHFDSEVRNEMHFGNTLETVIDISGRSWKRTTGNSLDQPGPQAFIRSLSTSAWRSGWLSIWLIHVGGKPMAMEYQLIDGGNVHALRADFDAGCTDISPGSVLFRQLLERLFQRGLGRYYMGPGDNAYKKHWADASESLQRIVVYSRSFRGRMVWIVDSFMKPWARRLRDRWSTRRKMIISTMAGSGAYVGKRYK
jgi:CelD/BcsL family acetyltransferase involved in cellulose biosynthesis